MATGDSGREDLTLGVPAAPVYFGDCFGWLHDGGGRRGVILCSPTGYEEVSCHRTWLRFAEALAHAGMPVLRFDYPDSGDSAGDDQRPERVEAWITGIISAVDFLRRERGVSEIALVGLRLGATLAVAAAHRLSQDGKGVDALALLAPCTSGAGYAKELRALAMLARARGPSQAPQTTLEAGGFYFAPETVQALKALDPAATVGAAAPRVLILDRPEAPGGEGFAAQFRTAGAAVEAASFTEYTALMSEPERSQYPATDFARVVDWLGTDSAPASVRTGMPEATLTLPHAVEHAVWVDGAQPVFGIHTVPRQPADARSAVLILNTAATHHIGTYRLSVAIARRLAQNGIAAFRFDCGGVGDSPSVPDRPDNAFDRTDLVPDVRRCIDWLAGQGYTEIVAYGLCSGAWLGYHAALADARITGTILLNLQNLWEGSRTARKFESNRRYLSLLRSANTWRRLAKGEINVTGIAHVLASRFYETVKVRLARTGGRLTGAETVADRTRRELRGLAARGAQTAIIFVGTETGLEEMELHFGEHGRDLVGEPGLAVTIIPEGDHLFSTKAARDSLLDLMDRQFHDGHFAPVSGPPAPAGLIAGNVVSAAAVLPVVSL